MTTPKTNPRLEHGAQGNDFVALTPGQPFDPFAELDAVIAHQEAEEAIAIAEAESPSSPVAKPTPMVLPPGEPPTTPSV